MFVFFPFFAFLALVNGLCYTPDGSLSNDVPCNPGDPASVCCTAGFLCMSNGLCQPSGWHAENSDQFIRGTCTDKEWAAPQCRGYCVKENPSGGEWVMRCSNGTANALGSWCCSDDKCCTNGSTKLTLGNATVTATAGVKLSETAASTGIISSASSTATDTPASSQTTAAAPSSSANGINTLAIGLGVGIGLGVASVMALIVGLWMRTCRRRQKKLTETRATDDTDGTGKQVHEVAAPGPVHELYGDFEGHQLPAGVVMPPRGPMELAGDNELPVR